MVTSIACVGVLFVGPFPVRTWWAQHNRATQIQKQISVLDAANAKLRTKVDELNDPATIEGLGVSRLRHGAPGRVGLRHPAAARPRGGAARGVAVRAARAHGRLGGVGTGFRGRRLIRPASRS